MQRLGSGRWGPNRVRKTSREQLRQERAWAATFSQPPKLFSTPYPDSKSLTPEIKGSYWGRGTWKVKDQVQIEYLPLSSGNGLGVCGKEAQPTARFCPCCQTLAQPHPCWHKFRFCILPALGQEKAHMPGKTYPGSCHPACGSH